MRKLILAVGLGLLAVALPLTAGAQSSSTTTGDLSIERKQKRSVVMPRPSADQIRSDADTAVNEYAAGKPPGALINQTSPVRVPSRPDLNYDVTGGIQKDRLNKAGGTR